VSADDVIAIQQLAVSYADAMSRGDAGTAVLTFTSDGRLETPSAEPVIGHAALETTIAEKISALQLVFQTVHLGLIAVDGDHAAARFPITEWSRRAYDDQPFLFLGWYEDQVIHLAEGWRFSRRRLVPRTFARPNFMTGELLPLSALNLEV
jgi:hypothetical protein